MSTGTADTTTGSAVLTPQRPSPERGDWDRLSSIWPNRRLSRFVEAGGLRFHVQVMGAAPGTQPVMLLVHGTGASTHSWGAIAPLLAERFTVVMPDLPGHGFTSTPTRTDGLSLPGMAASVTALMAAIGVQPTAVVGHSAGAAVLARMCLDGGIAPATLISLNGAFRPFQGGASGIFTSIARLLFLNPLTPRFFAWRAGDPRLVERLITGTGSTLTPAGLKLYQELFRNPAHVAGALGMMANWDLRPLEIDLPRLTQRLILVACGRDDAIPPDVAFSVRDRMAAARATVEYIRDLGHLAHEERPDDLAGLILRHAAAV